MTIGEPLDPNRIAEEPIKVLCVDDNHDVADSEALLLQLVGFDALACYDGLSALNLVEEFHPGVCLIDLNMPRMSGDVLARRLRSSGSNSPPVLVAVTAQDDQESCRLIKNAGFDLHLVKPVAPDRLVQAISCVRAVPTSKPASSKDTSFKNSSPRSRAV